MAVYDTTSRLALPYECPSHYGIYYNTPSLSEKPRMRLFCTIGCWSPVVPEHCIFRKILANRTDHSPNCVHPEKLKKFDIPANLRYTYNHIRDGSIRDERGINCPRTQTVYGFRAVFPKKSRRVQCTRRFAGFWG